MLTKIIFGLGTIAAWIYIYYDFVDKWISNFEYRRIIEVIFGIITGLICLYFSKYIPEDIRGHLNPCGILHPCILADALAYK